MLFYIYLFFLFRQYDIGLKVTSLYFIIIIIVVAFNAVNGRPSPRVGEKAIPLLSPLSFPPPTCPRIVFRPPESQDLPRINNKRALKSKTIITAQTRRTDTGPRSIRTIYYLPYRTWLGGRGGGVVLRFALTFAKTRNFLRHVKFPRFVCPAHVVLH